ncbi:MAG: radical SAM family heme chaperone HemW [Rickettsiales bacterium]|jgi:oxygen-independent coproporphyrinogen-3 oxidase|nr:radical SAM family heme chaperone HemW [Rickettsiales bacterium]
MTLQRPFSIYVHFPFCVSKCAYCSFASEALCGREAPDLLPLYLKELDFYRDIMAERPVSSIYFGGGTPSLMRAGAVVAILERIAKNWPIEEDAEITLEANPATIDRAKMAELRGAGVNRISLGIQSFDDEELHLLGRAHNAREARAAIADAAAEFSNYNLDFIYGLPGQSVEDWARTLDEAVDTGAPHLSLYQLSVERGTEFYRRGIKEAEEGRALAMYALAGRRARRYEVSNYARAGYESKHNLNYWRGRDYVGIGAAAAGRITLDGKFYETQNPRTAEAWTEGLGCDVRLKPLTRPVRAREIAMTALRMVHGISYFEFKRNSGLDFFSVVRTHGALVQSDRGVRISTKWMRVLDRVLLEIL